MIYVYIYDFSFQSSMKFIVAENHRKNHRRDYQLRKWKTSVFSSSQKGIYSV